MTFLEALRTGRPMRRAPSYTTFVGPWLYLGDASILATCRYPWLRLDNGEETTLGRYDYLAEDWSVMP